jgi:hypothetical protein
MLTLRCLNRTESLTLVITKCISLTQVITKTIETRRMFQRTKPQEKSR